LKWITHLISASCFVYILLNYIPISYLGFILAIVASIIPDYFERVSGVRHRSVYFHNWVIPLVTLILIADPTLAGIPIGYGHHLALDSLTKRGVYIGSKKRIKGFLYSTDPAHNAIVILVHCLLLMMFLAS